MDVDDRGVAGAAQHKVDGGGVVDDRRGVRLANDGGDAAGGRRLVQQVEGYEATIVAGQVTMEKGEFTGARPGGLYRAK